MVVSFVCKCCWLLGSQLSVAQYVTIIIAIVGSPPSGCSCCCCCGVPVALGGKDVDKDVDRGHVDVVDVDKGLWKQTNKHALDWCYSTEAMHAMEANDR